MPEEIKRILTERISRWLFIPTAAASAHLLREGLVDAQIEEVGDVMYYVALYPCSRLDASDRILAQLGLAPASYVLDTVHRAEDTDYEQRLQPLWMVCKQWRSACSWCGRCTHARWAFCSA